MPQAGICVRAAPPITVGLLLLLFARPHCLGLRLFEFHQRVGDCAPVPGAAALARAPSQFRLHRQAKQLAAVDRRRSLPSVRFRGKSDRNACTHQSAAANGTEWASFQPIEPLILSPEKVSVPTKYNGIVVAIVTPVTKGRIELSTSRPLLQERRKRTRLKITGWVEIARARPPRTASR